MCLLIDCSTCLGHSIYHEFTRHLITLILMILHLLTFQFYAFYIHYVCSSLFVSFKDHIIFISPCFLAIHVFVTRRIVYYDVTWRRKTADLSLFRESYLLFKKDAYIQKFKMIILIFHEQNIHGLYLFKFKYWILIFHCRRSYKSFGCVDKLNTSRAVFNLSADLKNQLHRKIRIQYLNICFFPSLFKSFHDSSLVFIQIFCDADNKLNLRS